MVVVERDRKTFLALQQESARIKFKGIVVFGDFNAVVRRYATEGKRIAHLDFDGVENFNRNGFAEKFFALVNEVNADSYAYTFQPRGKADAETETLCRSLGMEKKACKKSNGVVDNSLDQGKIRATRYRVKELAEIFTSRILPSWQHSEVQGYRGCRTAKNNRNDGGCSMQFILGKRWTNENAPFEDAGL